MNFSSLKFILVKQLLILISILNVNFIGLLKRLSYISCFMSHFNLDDELSGKGHADQNN